MASSPVNCSSSTSASSCCSSQLLEETMGAAEGVGGAARSALSRPYGSSNIWARSAGSGGGAAGGSGGGAAGGTAGGAAVGGADGGGGERRQQDQLFHTLEAQFERSRRMQFGGGRGSRGGF